MAFRAWSLLRWKPNLSGNTDLYFTLHESKAMRTSCSLYHKMAFFHSYSRVYNGTITQRMSGNVVHLSSEALSSVTNIFRVFKSVPEQRHA